MGRMQSAREVPWPVTLSFRKKARQRNAPKLAERVGYPLLQVTHKLLCCASQPTQRDLLSDAFGWKIKPRSWCVFVYDWFGLRGGFDCGCCLATERYASCLMLVCALYSYKFLSRAPKKLIKIFMNSLFFCVFTVGSHVACFLRS
jgi:hypothetical protein